MYVRIDEHGRIVIPAEIRRAMNIYQRDKVYIEYKHNYLIIKKENTIGSIERTLDKLGRFTIPTSIRKDMGISCGARGRYGISEGNLALTRSDAHCIYCGSMNELKEFRGIYICSECIWEVKNNELWSEAY